MKLGTRIFICFFLIFAVCFYYPIDWMIDNLRIRYLEGVEDPLVDQANILAAAIGREMETGQFDPEKWYAVFRDVSFRTIPARIYELQKTHVDLQIYMTDHTGKIIFDSENRKNVGADYSTWRDVRLTLAGRYGARTTRKYVDEPTSSVLYIAAPIRVNGKTAGVLTVAKPTTNINNFLEGAKPRMFNAGLLAMLTALLLSLFASFWITRPIKRLTQYAHDIRKGKRTALPKLDLTEIGDMGKAFEKMREALEGKRYVEQYIQTLTHEIKSPLSAIRGAAELLEEKMPLERRARFMSNIRNETNRIQKIVDRMLELAELESLKILRKMENIAFCSLIKTVLEGKAPLLSKKNVTPNVDIPEEILVNGDSFLLYQAIANLIQNAIDFSPSNSQIEIITKIDGQHLVISVRDEGPGIPDFARNKIFDKFFSLQRPDSGKKSTGLGLNLVREVAKLHNGRIHLENRLEGGVCAEFVLPL